MTLNNEDLNENPKLLDVHVPSAVLTGKGVERRPAPDFSAGGDDRDSEFDRQIRFSAHRSEAWAAAGCTRERRQRRLHRYAEKRVNYPAEGWRRGGHGSRFRFEAVLRECAGSRAGRRGRRRHPQGIEINQERSEER